MKRAIVIIDSSDETQVITGSSGWEETVVVVEVQAVGIMEHTK